jgi:ankyrin repeat protein
MAGIIIDKLDSHHRCLYLNSPAMVAGIRTYLAAAGLDVNEQVKKGALVLSSDQSLVRLLLDAGANANAKNAFDATALLWAARDGAKAHLLIERGADVNAQSKQGRTPLMLAAWLKDELSNVAVALEGARYRPPFADGLPHVATHCNRRYSAAPCARSNSTMSA